MKYVKCIAILLSNTISQLQLLFLMGMMDLLQQNLLNKTASKLSPAEIIFTGSMHATILQAEFLDIETINPV